MPTQLAHVQPGDPITADQWNLIVDAVNQLQQPVLAGPTNNVAIAGLVPAGTGTDPIRIADTLQILGQNFGYSLGLTTVTLVGPAGQASLSASGLQAGSSDSRLIVKVPTIPGVTANGNSVTVTVSNGLTNASQSATAQLVVVSLLGDIPVSFRPDVTPNPNPNPMTVNAPADFAFSLQAKTNLAATFALTADIVNPTATLPANFVNSIELRDSTGASLRANMSVYLQPNEVRNILVRVPALPSAWQNESFLLTLKAASGGVSNGANCPVTVGSAVAAADPTISAVPTGFAFISHAGTSTSPETDPNNASFDFTTVKLKRDRQIVISFNVQVNVGLAPPVAYDLTVPAQGGSSLSGWKIGLVNSLAQISDTTSHLVKVGIQAPPTVANSTDAQSGVVVFRISRANADVDWSEEFAVQLL